jgi:signal peptidase complex subunit 1
MFVSLLVQKLTAALIFLPTIIIYFIAADYSRNNYCDNRIVVSADRIAPTQIEQVRIDITQKKQTLRKAIKGRKEQEIAIKMDYQGQKLSENLFYYIILLFGSVGWIYGYILQDFTYVFYSWSVGVGISLVLCVPDWPIYNKHPIKWLESIPDRSDDSDSDEEEEETKKSK